MIVNNNLIKIESFIEQVRGVSYSKKDISDKPKEGFTPVLRSNNIDKGQINFDDLVYLKNSKIKKKQMLRKGDILITASTGSLKVIGKNGFCYKDYKATFGAFCKVVRPINIYAGYLKHFFQSPQYFSYIQNIVNGANINNIKNEHINNFKIPYPPHISEIQHPKSEIENISLSTQKRIAEILDNAAALRDKTKQLLAEYDELAQSIFLDMFGDPVTNPKGWEKKKLQNNLIKVEKIGKSFTAKEIDYADIASIDNSKNTINQTSKYNLDERPSRAQQILKSGDVLFSTVRPNLKNIAINRIDDRIASTGFFICRTKKENLNNYYLFELLKTKSVTNYFVSMTSGANYPAIKNSEMKKFELITPPIHLQNQFAEKIKLIEQQKDLAKQELQESEDLFQALLQKAFKGELV